jgi:hypothetical protein
MVPQSKGENYVSWFGAEYRKVRPHSDAGFFRGIVRNGDLDWRLISTAPYNRDIELRTANRDETFCLPFPCRHTNDGWMNSDLGTRVSVEPMHWRAWPEE